MSRSIPDDAAVTPLRFGASIALFQDGAVLLVQRARAPWRGAWSLPGGGIEAGELPHEAALRELAEETGIIAAIEGLLDIIEIEAKDEGGAVQRYRLSVFYGRPIRGALRAASDAAAARWVPVGELAKLPMTEGTAALIARAGRRLDGAPA
jgi:8-oxo-dGTP diphosphatase